jgi:hypothetical protein
MCSSCIASTHKWLLFHRLEVSSILSHKIHCLVYKQFLAMHGAFFEKSSLKTIRLHFQLGHTDGMCSNPVPTYTNDFVVIALNRIHEISLDYCGCGQAASRTSQLLQVRLFPSTVTDPKTAAHFLFSNIFNYFPSPQRYWVLNFTVHYLILPIT